MRKISTLVITFAVLTWVSAVMTSAQEGERLRPGDRVQTSDGEYGTVVEVDPDAYSRCQLVLFDYQRTTGSRGTNVCSYGNANVIFLVDDAGQRIRDGGARPTPRPAFTPTAPAGPAGPLPGLPPGAPANVLPSSAACAGEPLLDLDSSGRAPSDALFREVIKKSLDQGPDQFGNGQTITTITRITTGTPYTWKPLMDFQTLGSAEKTVHPVRARYIRCASFQTEFRLMETTTDAEFSCYVDEGFSQWQCAVRRAPEFRSWTNRKP